MQIHRQVDGRTITGYVDREQAFTVEDKEAIEPLYQVVTRDEDTGEITVEVLPG
jgi:hypothetical protein